MRKRSLLFAPALAAAALVPVPAASAHATVTTVVSGLDNPRGLDFGKDGRLYVAEAGHGGSHCISDPEMGTVCLGFSSRISLINVHRHSVRPVISGLLSGADEHGFGATGIDGVSVLGRNRIYGIETESAFGLPPSVPAAARAQAGDLILGRADGSWRTVANVGNVDYRWANRHKDLVPGQFPDANPYGVLASRHSQWVVDAGANTLDRIDRHGRVHIVKFFPNPPASDAVPTCLDRGPDGKLYIGELTGGGNAPGSSVVWRYNPRTNSLRAWARGLTAVTGCGFGRDGHFYATEFSTLGLDSAAPGTGAVVRARHGRAPKTIVSGLDFPGGFAAGHDGALYVSDWSIAPANSGGGPTGSVVRIDL